MSARFLTQVEKDYYEAFKEGSLVWDMYTYDKRYEKLLRSAIKNNKALKREDFVLLYGEKDVKYLEDLATAQKWTTPDGK